MANDSNGRENEKWAWQIISLLQSLGVDHFFIAPGSRSSPLSLAAAEHPLCATTVFFDERSLCFAALGYGKGIKTPAAVIVTSGTAAGNLLPAIMEAFHDHIPLLILTADRPPELRDCGANQTTHQVDLFASFVRWRMDVSCPSSNIPQTYLPSLLSFAVFKTKTHPSGVVHLNCMFREPLHSEGEIINTELTPAVCRYIPSIPTVSPQAIDELAAEISQVSKGICVIGSIPTHEQKQAIASLCQKLQWPIFCDISSRFAAICSQDEYISYFDYLLDEISEVTYVLQFGKPFVSKKLASFISKHKPEILHVADHNDRQDPLGLTTQRLFCDITWFAKTIAEKISPQQQSLTLDLIRKDRLIKKEVCQFFDDEKKLSPPQLFHYLARSHLNGANLFIGNSMPIRYANLFFHPQSFAGQVFVNRGVSGIDGNISTAFGIYTATKKPVIALIGDLTCLHDINALALLANTSISIVVINNGGGGIFSFLPSSQKATHFESHMALAHNLSFESSAQFAHIEYTKAQSIDEVVEALCNRACHKPKLIELMTNRQEEFLDLQTLENHIQKINLCSECSVLEI